MSEKGTTIKIGSGGIGLCGATFIVFLVLKLTGTIDWSWWWVTAPLWGGWALVLGMILLAVILAAAFVGLIAAWTKVFG